MKATIIIDDEKLLAEIKRYADRIGVGWQRALARVLATGMSRKSTLRRYYQSPKGRACAKRARDRADAKARAESYRRQRAAGARRVRRV